MSSGNAGLGPPTKDVGFTQQGQVDWVAFGKTTVSLSLDVLARFQASGVQELTYAGVIQLTTRFKLPELGRQRVWDAIQRLRVHGGASQLLYFGFGHKSFLRFLSDSVSGLKCIALCSCIAEMHTEVVAARILSSLWAEFEYPEDYEPSQQQFRGLIKACGGALAASPFPEIAGRMGPANIDPKYEPRCSEPAETAKVLRALFDISMGLRQSITILGGAECSFAAAVAYWIFNLDIFVEDEAGNHIFSSSVTSHPIEHPTAQVHVRYMDSVERSQVIVSHSTFVLGDPTEMLVYHPDGSLLELRRRVSWHRCLQYTFGQRFIDLLSIPTTLQNLLGCVARVYSALAESEAEVGGYRRNQFLDFTEASYGMGFLDSAESIFPELALALKGRRKGAEDILRESFQQAQMKLEALVLFLKQTCRCVRCSSSGGENSPSICLVILAATLADLVTMLSAVQFESDHNLDPTPEGLRMIYIRNNVALEDAHNMSLEAEAFSEEIYPHTADVDVVLHLQRSGGYEITGSTSTTKTLGDIIGDLVRIFTGCDFDLLPLTSTRGETRAGPDITAVSRHGICVFIEGLVSMTTRADLLRRIHVMPGHIARARSKNPGSVPMLYDEVRDRPAWSPPTLPVLEVSEGIQGGGQEDSHPTLPQIGMMTAMVIEPVEAGKLAFFYRITTPEGDIFVPPGKITMSILENRGLVPCNRYQCTSNGTEPSLLHTVKEGWAVTASKTNDWTGLICYNWANLRTSEVVGCTEITVNGAICLPLTAIIQDVFEDFGWDLDIDVDPLLFLISLHVVFDMMENLL